MFQFSTSYTKHMLWKAAIVATVCFVAGHLQQATAVGPTEKEINPATMCEMVENGQGQQALEQISEVAYTIGHWAPAPDDTILFDPMMSRRIRGAVLNYDELPAACTDNRANMTFDAEGCATQFWALEPTVRFGRSFFTTPQEDGTYLVRSVDDMLSTYIEETGHSWQEYLYETEGQGGERARLTSLEAANYWAPGSEYQVKRYILSLDGGLLNLSDEQRTTLKSQICLGYANPVGAEVPPYGAPADWPNPEGWPTVNPTADELLDFCKGIVVESQS